MKPITCEVALVQIHELLDRFEVDEAPSDMLREHLERCSGCRQRASEYRVMLQALREMPRLQLPADDLERVWDRTVRAPIALKRPRLASRWVVAAVAAVLFLAIVGPWFYGDYQRRHALEDFRTAMRITNLALRKSADETNQVMRVGVAPAIKRVPGMGLLLRESNAAEEIGRGEMAP
jgi:predicted anti-sigma-YlaC factor YlaD